METSQISINELMGKQNVGCMYIMGYYSGLKIDELLTYAIT